MFGSFFKKGSLISDIFITGYSENSDNNTFVFRPLFDKIYFEIEDKIHEIFLSDRGKIDVKKIETISPWFDVDEDDFFSISSIHLQILKTEDPVIVTGVNIENTCFSPLLINIEKMGRHYKLELNAHNIFGFSLDLSEIK